MEKKAVNKRILILLISLFVVYTIWFVRSSWWDKPKIIISANNKTTSTLWKYQCIDTMKTSRDKARIFSGDVLDQHITSQIEAIVALGGNCVAIDTPYDAEFLPVIKKWVTGARKHNLHIWFRGNFSSWEGWFEYPKGMTVEGHIQKTNAFILNNPELFEDGDIFTPSPEAENGGPFNQVEKDEYAIFREYLTREYQEAKQSFVKIGKNVEVNWLSMNGGLAKRIMDQETVDAVGKVVAIDHYIKTPQEMGEFIRYFYNNFGAQVVIGEWGAPIPQINGEMTEGEQATFIKELLDEQYHHREMIYGTSYWVLYDGSTSLLNPDGSQRKAFEVIKDYFRPGHIQGTLTDTNGTPLAGIPIAVGKFEEIVRTDEEGKYEIIAPAGDAKLSVNDAEYFPYAKNVKLKRGSTYQVNLTLTPIHVGLLEKIYQDFLRLVR